jgi:MFS family permease
MSAIGLTRSLRSTPLGIAIAVSALHSLNDAYTSFLPPLLPRIMGKLDLSITLAAGLMTALALGSSLAQPLMGRLADRRGRRALVVLGPMATGTFLSMMGLAPGFWTLVLCSPSAGSAAQPSIRLALRSRPGWGREAAAACATRSFRSAARQGTRWVPSRSYG